jgi:3-hydroxyacyl-CoA dehydrogenase/enoyl-CoA hydratase/3-hydroxybutyryl-CoA epimerase
MIEDGIAPALIENGAREAGFPVGPLALMDEVALSLSYSADKQNREDLGDAWVENASWRVRKHFVEQLDRCGRRFGAGYYEYPEDSEKFLWPGVAEVYVPMDPQPPLEDVKNRFLYIQALEAVRAYEDGVLENIHEGDLAATLSIGYPTYTGGPFSLIDTVGADKFVNTCERFAEHFGERWKPTPGLIEQARNNLGFYLE